MLHDRLNIHLTLVLFSFVFLLMPRLGATEPLLPPLNEPSTSQRLAGKFIWFDLATTDLDNQKAFYGDVFDWTFRTLTDASDGYTLISSGGRAIAGMFFVKPHEDAGVGALWIGLMSTDDLASAVAAVKQGDGKIHTEPTAVARRGTYALLLDPEGALFGLLKSDSGDPPDRTTAIGHFLWMDLFADQPTKAGDFYRQLADYEITRNRVKEGVDRLILSSQGKPRAGIVPLPKNANRAGWLPYVRVGSVDETLEKVKAAGGHVMVSPHQDLLDGNLAIFADPQGGVLGIVKWDEPLTDGEGR